MERNVLEGSWFWLLSLMLRMQIKLSDTKTILLYVALRKRVEVVWRKHKVL